jgi:hypothetical protein
VRGITRRHFLGCVAGSLTAGLPFDVPRRVEESSRRVLLDLGEHCALRESVAGYESALASLGTMSRSTLLIVPAALDILPPARRAIVSRLRAGATVILESGAGFCGGRDFRAHRIGLRDHFGVHVAAPVRLWSARPDSRGMPYIDYTWPSPVQIRDFSCVVPLGRQQTGGEIIAGVAGLPVGLKRRIGPGKLIFLGSPLGTALWAGDAEARRWLREVVASSRRL